MHPGPKPAAQPRTLRQNSLRKGTAPAGFDGELPIDPLAGVPIGAPGAAAGQRYQDKAASAAPTQNYAGRTPDPKPFGAVR